MLDPFLGSGTTALAAVRLNRRCIGFDISGRYVQLARKRLSEDIQNEEARRPPANVSAEQLHMPSSAEREAPKPTPPCVAKPRLGLGAPTGCPKP